MMSLIEQARGKSRHVGDMARWIISGFSKRMTTYIRIPPVVTIAFGFSIAFAILESQS
jgi:hypothetical protein